MITYLSIENFKGWKNTGDLNLAPITVLFGTNSSGKSSISQFLMMLKQTTESSDRNSALQLGGGQRSIVDLGTYEDVLHGHETGENISFSISWNLPAPISVGDPINGASVDGDVLHFEAEIGQSKKGSSGRIQCESFAYWLMKGGKNILTISFHESKNETGKFDISAEPQDQFRLSRRQGRAWALPDPQRFYGFPQELQAYYQNAQDLEDLPLAIEKLFGSMAYLGPLRAFPSRQYIWSGETPPDVGGEGEHWLSAYLSAADRKISPGRGKKNALKAQPFAKVIGSWLKKIGLVHDFEAEPVAKGTREYRVRVKVAPNSAWVAIPDVGFGVSQFMPLLVQCFYAPANSVIVVEQPELHLHPKVQQNLADLFIEVIRSLEDGNPRNIQLIIESHSEHFLNRLQLRIAEEKIGKEDVAAYFCSHDGRGVHEATELSVDDYGNITNWPRDFFGDSFTDIAERQKAGLRRRMEKRKNQKDA